MLLADQAAATNVASPTLVLLALGATTVFVLGHRVAVWQRARVDHRRTKAAVKPLRKDKWSAWGAAVRTAVLVFVAAAILVSWAANEVRQAAGR